jgi:hypothetical protein
MIEHLNPVASIIQRVHRFSGSGVASHHRLAIILNSKKTKRFPVWQSGIRVTRRWHRAPQLSAKCPALPSAVHIPFVCSAEDAGMTMTQMQVTQEQQHPADSMVGERLWNTLHTARTEGSPRQVADLQDALFRFYLPMARGLAHAVVGESGTDRVAAEQAAELGLAQAILEWPQRTSGGFRRSARSAVMRQLVSF